MKRTVAAMTIAGLALAAGTANAGILTTEPPNNGSGGVWMDLTDLTSSGEFLSITQFDIGGFTGTVGTDVDVEVWIRPGTYVGNNSDSSGWTLTQTLTVTRAGTSTPVAMPLNVNITIPDGETVAVYLQALDSGGIRYTGTGANPPQTTFSDANLELFSDNATTASSAFGGSIFAPRTFSGSVHYTVIPAPASLALLGLGGLVAARRRR